MVTVNGMSTTDTAERKLGQKKRSCGLRIVNLYTPCKPCRIQRCSYLTMVSSNVASAAVVVSVIL